MRLFIAIAVEDEAAAAVEQVRERLAASGEDLRWSRPADRHVTLQFLGEVAPERAACVSERLATVRSPQVPVRIAGVGFFLRAGVFWAGVDAAAGLLALQQRVTAATRACGFVAEPRPYRPHITLARSRERRGAGALAALERAVDRGRIRLDSEFIAREFALYESLPGPEGSRYEVRARFPLGLE
jgi:RNA 2',3'-cyclic 3'-phosphodiesterase